MALIYISGAWVAGILVGAQAGMPLALVLLGLVPLPLLIFRRRRRAIVLLSLSLLIFFGGAAYYPQSLPEFDEDHLATYNDQGPVAIRGTLFQEPEVREKTGRLYLAATEIMLDGQWREIEGQALLFVPRFSDYSYGDVLLVTGEPETPPRFDSFDYQGYLANQGIHTTMLYPQIEVLDTGQGFAPLAWIYSLRGQMADSLAEAMPEPQASLAQGITLGIRDNIPSSVRQDFAYSGTAHLLAISGLHLGIVAGILLSLGLWLFGRRHYIYIWLALGLVWLYVVLTGMQPPVVRAAIMASLFLTAELLGRQRTSITALAFAAAIMVGFNPQILWSASL